MNRKSAGLTLLEVLIAITIFAISVSIVYGLYASIMSVVLNVEDKTGLNDQVQTAFTRLNRDLAGLYRGEKGYLLGLDSTDPLEDEPILQFISSAQLSFNPAAAPVPLSVIRYYLVPEEQGDSYSLIRSDAPAKIGEVEDELTIDDSQETRKFTICQGLMEVRIHFMDREGDDRSVWDTREGSEEEQENDNRFPAWIDMEFVFSAGAENDAEGSVYSTAVSLRPGRIVF